MANDRPAHLVTCPRSRLHTWARSAKFVFFPLSVLAFLQSCKKPDTQAAQAQEMPQSHFERTHPPVLCFERLEDLARSKPTERPWHELSTDARLSLCQGATSTAPVDCFLAVHDALGNFVRARQASEEKSVAFSEASTTRTLAFAAQACTGSGAPTSGERLGACIVTMLESRPGDRTALSDAIRGCRAERDRAGPARFATASPTCIQKFLSKETVAMATNPFVRTVSAAEAQRLCAGSTVPSRPFSCLTSFPHNLPGASKRDALTLCSGNDNPNAISCFHEASRKPPEAQGTSLAPTLTSAQSARLCSKAQ